jgi:hypothetical protein
VSTPVPEVARYSHLARVAVTPDEFIVAVERALGETRDEARAARSAEMQTETWAARVSQVARTVDEMIERRTRERGTR